MIVALRLFLLLALLTPTAVGALSPWMVFFNPGGARIRGSFGATLDSAAAWYRNTDIRSFRVIGFADRSGSSETNRRLSLSRAEAVKAGLVRRGVPARMIQVEAKGENDPLVETRDGVPDYQNRRVEIVAERMCRPPPKNVPVC